jgi:HEAT repeat protein
MSTFLLYWMWPQGERAAPRDPELADVAATESGPEQTSVAGDNSLEVDAVHPATAPGPGDNRDDQAGEARPSESLALASTSGGAPPFPDSEDEAETTEPSVPDADDEAAPTGKPEAPTAPKPMKRRRVFTEQELSSQLARAPEVRSFTMESMAALVKAYYEGMKVSGGDWNGSLEPTCLLRHRPDLANLPVRAGSASRLDYGARGSLQALAKKLHAYVDTTVARDKPDTTWLRDALFSEKRGSRPLWLRPAAVPVLLQLLMHEPAPVRAMLVEILAEISGKAATTALAQRAVFDLSPEVRQAAVQALANRPRKDYRTTLIQAMRYPWAPAADHAAEAFIALEDREAILGLVSMLKLPDPAAPAASGGNRVVTRELVRINHRTNCMMCHPPAIRRSDPVTDMVPGVSLQLPESNFRMLAMCKETGRVVVNPLLVRADVTFMRQDFSVRQSTVLPGALAATDLRFDYLVRTRPARVDELARQKNRSTEPASYEQREAVLFALRELTGQDAGPTTDAWQRLYPQAEVTAEAAKVATTLVRAHVNVQERLLEQYQKSDRPVYTQALALAIPRLKGFIRDRAQQMLTERLTRNPDIDLVAELQNDNAEVRRAAAHACVLMKARARTPDLIALLEDPEPGVVQAARAALKDLNGQDFGPSKNGDIAQAMADWKEWWAKQGVE